MIRVVRRLCPAILAVLAGVILLGCDDGGGNDVAADPIRSVVAIRLTSGTGLRGATMTLRIAPGFTLVSVASGDPPLATASCQTNVTGDLIIASCATTTTFSAPLDAWRVSIDHLTTQAVLDAVASLECEASDATGTTFAVACVAVP